MTNQFPSTEGLFLASQSGSAGSTAGSGAENVAALPSITDDPAAYFETLRRTGPVVKISDGTYILTRRADILAALRNTQIFDNYDLRFTKVLGTFEFARPDHARFRSILNRFFTKSALNPVELALRKQTAEAIERIAAQNACDIMADLAVSIPHQAFLTLMGLPLGDRDKIIHWNDAKLTLQETGKSNPLDAADLCVYLYRATCPDRYLPGSPGMLPKLLSGPDAITGEEAFAITLILMGATHSTTAAIGFALLRLAADPGLRRRLRANNEKIAKFIEEVVGLNTPIPYAKRCTKKEVAVAGVTLPAGSMVQLNLGGIDPDEYTGRGKGSVASHLGFSAGAYRCLGANLARMELRVVIAEWLRRIPDFELDADSAPPLTVRGSVMPSAVPLRWDAR